MKSTTETVPFCVDLDGTLILTDGFLEALVRLLKARPWYLFLVPLWLLRGRAETKQKVTQLVTFDAARGKGYEKLFTYVRADNVGALAFYLGLGFRIVGTAQRQAKIGQRYVDEVIIERFL